MIIELIERNDSDSLKELKNKLKRVLYLSCHPDSELYIYGCEKESSNYRVYFFEKYKNIYFNRYRDFDEEIYKNYNIFEFKSI